MKSLHEIHSAIHALEGIAQKQDIHKDESKIKILIEILNSNSEIIANLIDLKDSVKLANDSKIPSEQAIATTNAFDLLKKISDTTGVSKLLKSIAVIRASDAVGLEFKDVFEQRPRSDEDLDECQLLGSTPEGRSFVYEVLAAHLDLLQIGVVEHRAIEAQKTALQIAAQGREPWPKLNKRERVSVNSGLSMGWGQAVAQRAGFKQALSKRLGVSISVEQAVDFAIFDIAEVVKIPFPENFSTSAIIKAIREARNPLYKMFKLGEQEARKRDFFEVKLEPNMIMIDQS